MSTSRKLTLSVLAGLFGGPLVIWLFFWGAHFYATALPWPCPEWRCPSQQVPHD